MESPKPDTTNHQALIDQLLDAALAHVPFDGWGPETFAAAITDSGVAHGLARALCPRGAVDLAVAYHARGDRLMQHALAKTDLTTLRYRDRVAKAVRLRIEAISDKEAVRRASTLFSLPHLAADGARMVWGTSDLIWATLGDTSDDINWYSKRAILSGVYGATLLFWMGDDSPDHSATWAFLDRRIDNVMQFEKFKSMANTNPLLKAMMAGPNMVLSRLRAPKSASRADMPGFWSGKTNGSAERWQE